MKINKSDFVISAVRKKQYPADGLPEVAFVGRSNVGKSSLINTIINRKNLARTSGKPGKTQTINFYLINDNFHLVDLPGYGFAKVSRDIKEKWAEFIEEYLNDRPNLVGIIQLIDLRHPPTEDDLMMFDWLKHLGIPFLLVATKADKISRGQHLKHKKIIREKLMINNEDIQLFSAEDKTGKEEVLKWISGQLAFEEVEADEV
ncbi:MAG: ribosome biogenesis GTP-binding protein YihA/YsxC [Eubacteriales bacterium]|nr:ribosome biogenesis GTP-binding protein YihA/YsxC [Eubacteriales bacterium]NCC81138.1 YihA family ribosome biogenesis GTP-binding protein [Clostridia bacterium]